MIANDIDLSAYEGSREWVPIGYVERKGNAWTGYTYEMAKPFTGTMDGYGHTITNLVVSSNVDTARGNGLFGATTGTVSNLHIKGADVYGPAFVGVLAGANGGTIANCAVSGNVTAANNFGGGLAGWNLNGTITGCSSSAYVGGNLQPNYDGVDANMMGGLVGVNEGAINRCAATGDVNTKVTDRAVIDSNSYGQMTGYTHYENIGGLVGENYGTIRDCSASGSVKGYSQVGGLTSYNEGNISNCVVYAKVYSLVQNNYTNWQSPTVAAEYGSSEYTSIYFVKGNVYKNNVLYTGWDTKSRGIPMTAEEMTNGQALPNLIYDEPVWSFAAGSYPALIGLPAIS
ncbi:MAG: GLUG motif-containing protein [Oscillospiraceae bacterium]